MARVKTIETKADVPRGGEAVWDAIAESRGRVVGPFKVLLHVPELARRAAQTGAYVRFEGTLPQDVRELAILTVGREMDCLFEWAAHAPLARKAGVREAAIAAIRDRRFDALTADERGVVDYVSQLIAKKRVAEPVFRALEKRFGVPGVVELTGTVGHYLFIACTLNAFEVTPDASMEQLPVR
jgi:4-carboxymuconolactone decarboxylase